MQETVKLIRTRLNMSQDKFARLMGVSYATVNRWENGRVVPNSLSCEKLYKICKENKVPKAIYSKIPLKQEVTA